MIQGHKSNKPTGCLSIERVFDIDLIRETITHPKVYPYVSDDKSPSPDDYWPPMHNSIVYLSARLGDDHAGLFALHPANGVTVEVHTCLLPSAYGVSGMFSRLLIDWVWANTPYLRLITQVPECNGLARKLAIDSGLDEYGFNPDSFLHNGKLYGIRLMGISKGDVCL